MPRVADELKTELRRAWPYALLLAVALGTVLAVGAHQSNATPSEKRPFGWPGPASFENAVAMERGDLVLAASLPALLLGARALELRWGALAPRLRWVLATDAALLVAACFAAGGIGAFAAFRTPPEAYVAFCVAHALLALAFYSLAFLCSALLRRHATAAALGVWMAFNAAYEGIVRTSLYRTVGYQGLLAGQFPSWFYVAQALSPLSAYRGVLILWRDGFRDYVEKAALGQAVLPAWLNPATFVALMLALWVALPLGIASAVWHARRRRTSGAARRVQPQGAA